MSLEKLKIALVKQDVYQDLYIGNNDLSPEELLFSSIMRVGPIGLLTDFDCDFYIIKEDYSTECQLWKEILPAKRHAFLRQLKNNSIYNIAHEHSKFLQPGSKMHHGQFSVSHHEIDWEQYNIVISINISIPTKVVTKSPFTLWCYMTGEANHFIDKNYFGYDISFNQNIRGISEIFNGVIDFPYTFLQKNTLQQIMFNKLNRTPENRGIYAEINTTEERPVKSVPTFYPLTKSGHPIRLHQQRIDKNLTEIYDAKYFVKVGGRCIRGNSIIEAISTGTLVLMDPNDVYHSQLLPKSCWITSIEEALEKIIYLDKHPDEYNRLLYLQKELLQLFVYDMPLNCLIKAQKQKQKKASSIEKSRSTSKTKKLFYYIKKYTVGN